MFTEEADGLESKARKWGEQNDAFQRLNKEKQQLMDGSLIRHVNWTDMNLCIRGLGGLWMDGRIGRMVDGLEDRAKNGWVGKLGGK